MLDSGPIFPACVKSTNGPLLQQETSGASSHLHPLLVTPPSLLSAAFLLLVVSSHQMRANKY